MIDAQCVHRFGAASYPDGLAIDAAGYLWVTSILSNCILRISPDGTLQTMFEDSDEADLQRTEDAYLQDAPGRWHLNTAHIKVMRNISNLAFGGPTRQRIDIGNLLGDSLPYFDTDFTGVTMPHWDASLSELQRLYQGPE